MLTVRHLLATVEHMFDQTTTHGFARGALDALAECDIAAADAVGLEMVTAHVETLKRTVEVYEMQVAARAQALHEQGRSGTPADVLAKRRTMSRRDAHRVARRAMTASKAPAMANGVQSGSVSGAHVDALANAAAELTGDQQDKLFANDTSLATAASRLTPEQFGDHCRALARQIQTDEGAERFDQQRRDTRLTKFVNPRTGMYHLSGVFDPVTGATLFQAIDTETRGLVYTNNNADLGDIVASLRTDWDHVAAHALVNLVKGGRSERRGVHADVVVIIDADTLDHGPHDHTECRTSDGDPLAIASARRLLCTATQHLTIIGATGQVLALGTTTPTPNRAQRRALQAMYQSCAFEGCDTPFSHCELHHIRYRRHAGPTDLDNLLPLCVRHHHMVHEGRWRITLEPDRTLHIWRPDGTHHADTPLRTHQRRTHQRQTQQRQTKATAA